MNEPTVIQPALPSLPDVHQPPLPVGTVLEGMQICEVIGIGGFGIVYKAWDPMLERQVALKEYLPASLAIRLPSGKVKVRDPRHSGTFEAGLRSFINEARLLAQFDHAALVKVYRFWEMAGTAYMVMPLYLGQTLKTYLEQLHAPLPQAQLLTWLVALTEALEVMHSQQCYHRDISPENIIIQQATGLPILLDFGAARKAIGSVSQPFTVILKASYAPIEQYAEVASMTQGSWTDVYALAAVAHFLMTGKTPPPSVGRLVSDSYKALQTQTDLPYNDAIKLAVDQALALQPQDRTQTMAEFREALLTKPRDKKPAVPTVSTAVPSEPPFTKPNTGKRMVWMVCLLATLAIAIGLLATRPDTRTVKAIPPDVVETPEQTPSNTSSAVLPAFQSVLNKADERVALRMANTVLTIGDDLLRFEIQSPIKGYVAVYVLASDGALIQLLPNARVPSITVQANEWIWLPPSEEPIQAAGPAGENQVLVVVTEQARRYDHLSLQDHYGFGLVQHNATQLEGKGECLHTYCSDRMAAAWFTVEEVD